MAKITIKTTNLTLASELRAIQEAKEHLAERENIIKAELLTSLKKQGVRQIRLEDGTMYVRSERKRLVIGNEKKAQEWAEEHNCLKIDSTKALEIFRHLDKPEFFKVGLTEYLTVRRSKTKDDDIQED